MTSMKNNDECDICKSKRCSEECFNTHVGSIIALKKLFAEINVKGHIIDIIGP